MLNNEKLARALLPILYPSWPGRWGWTEATKEMKKHCFRRAQSVEKLVLQWEANKNK